MTIAAAATREIEPLVRLSDLDEYRVGLSHRLAGDWDDDKWTGFRTRFGVYGQKQPGVQMMRIKIPGGLVPLPWLWVLAQFNRKFCQGDAHITTRQDFQTYFVPLEKTAEALEFLYSKGMTTREACGNTLRNINACALAGNCPREHVDAGEVASRLARSWIRHPLVQHMPRKVKISVSGCATDCGVSAIHDLSFIATEKDGKKGFIVYAGGGLGGQPRRPARFSTSWSKKICKPWSKRWPACINAIRTASTAMRRASNSSPSVLARKSSAPCSAKSSNVYAVCPSGPGSRSPGASRARPPSSGRRWAWSNSMTDAFAVVGNPPLGLLSSDQFEGLARPRPGRRYRPAAGDPRPEHRPAGRSGGARRGCGWRA